MTNQIDKYKWFIPANFFIIHGRVGYNKNLCALKCNAGSQNVEVSEPKMPSKLSLLEAASSSAAELESNLSKNINAVCGVDNFQIIAANTHYNLTNLICPNEPVMSVYALQFLAEMRASSSISVKQINMYIFDEAIFLPNGVICVNNKVVLETLAPLPSPYYSDPVWDYYDRITPNLRPASFFYSLDKPVLVIEQPGLFNYGHWLIEIYPKVIFFAQQIKQNVMLIALPSIYKDWGFIKGMLCFLDIDAESVVWCDLSIIDSYETVQFKKVLYISPISKHLHPGYVSPWSIERVLDATRSVKEGPYRKIFVSRQDATTRFLLNESEVAKILQECGYVMIQTAILKFEEQIEIFKGATHVIGVFGASMTNIVFCQPGTRVMMIPPGNSIDHFYWDLASIRNFEYFYFNGEPVEGQEGMLNCNFTIEIPKFLEFLEIFDTAVINI